jgi:FKBP-type peptidyl-prolyl cis-trans isomerase
LGASLEHQVKEKRVVEAQLGLPPSTPAIYEYSTNTYTSHLSTTTSFSNFNVVHSSQSKQQHPSTTTKSFTMRFSLLSIAAVFAAAVSAADVSAEHPLDIDVTTKVECKRPSQKGDKIHVHYRGTLTDGKLRWIVSARAPRV